MAKKENKNDSKKNKHFFKDFKAELKKVIWPTPKQLVNNTIAVVTIVLITAVIVFVLDSVFDLGNRYGITKLQSIVDERFNTEENAENTDSTETENVEGEETESTENSTDDSDENQESSDEENTETSVEESAQ